MAMERVTFRIQATRIGAVDQLVEDGRYPNRSEALRSLIRQGLRETRHVPRWCPSCRRRVSTSMPSWPDCPWCDREDLPIE